MRPRKKKCRFCKKDFIPDRRLKKRQVTCGKKECVKKQSAVAKRRWQFKNRLIQRQMVRDWFKAHPDYLKNYRSKHPEFCEVNREMTRRRRHAERVDKRKRYFATPRNINEIHQSG